MADRTHERANPTAEAGGLRPHHLIKNQNAAVARYGMLKTIRQYGREQLAGDKEVVVRRRHRDYYLRLAERAEAEADWLGPRELQWLDRYARAIRDGRHWLDRVLAHDTEPSRERAQALWAVGCLASAQGRHRARPFGTRGMP
jgi:non-specific serine/threonine protein kinase